MGKDKALTGAAGEYYVAFKLSAMGYAVGLTTRGTRGVDLLVASTESGKSATVQVKTMLKDAFVRRSKDGPHWKWYVSKSRPPACDTFFYAFVDLKNDWNDLSELPDVFIVPSNELPSLLNEWGKDMVWCTIYEKTAAKYKNCWGLLTSCLS